MYFITYLYSVKSQIMQTSSISHIINCCRTIFYCKYGFYICYFLYHMLCLSRTKSLDGLCCSFCKTHPTKNKDFWFDLWIKFTIKGCLWWYSRKFDVIKCSMSCSNLKILHVSFWCGTELIIVYSVTRIGYRVKLTLENYRRSMLISWNFKILADT